MDPLLLELQSIAEAFVAARCAARPLAAFPGEVPKTLADAYRVQDLAIALGGRQVRGWKVAMIRPDLRADLGAERIVGPIFADARHELPSGGHAAVAVFEGGSSALEAEFVARFARDLEPHGAGFTAEDVLEALASLHAGIEVLSSPLAALGDLGPIAVVCDHCTNAGAVVGPEMPDWRSLPLTALRSRMVIDGVTAGEGSAASVPGGPVGALLFLARHLATRGRHLAAGDVVLTGASTGIHTVRPGVHARIEFVGVPACDVEVVAFRRSERCGASRRTPAAGAT